MPGTVKTITRDELQKKIDDGSDNLQIINVLAPESYALGFIPGSLAIPVADINRRWNELNPNKEIVTYCAQYECPASKQAAEKLAAQGFKVSAYEGGIKEWKEAGLPIQPEASRNLEMASDAEAGIPEQSGWDEPKVDRPSGLSGIGGGSNGR